ncbi:ABC transporter ATP-binding protein [Thermogymnomonas acidicola]|uniref:ABC transporter ATP-binding protein n=1 Tax=Thermogymnomonas acidicola TaxID=399579 RepID=UPI0009463E7E|nr:ABC transporter ATP-binding protein [Thermogymnomonas acidicola]
MEIETFSLSKTYDNGKQALRPIDISFRGPGIFSIIGLNGAGKTTLVRILATQLTPTSGTATVGGFDILRDTPRVREIIACVPQEARAVPPWLTPLQTVSSYLMWRGYTYRESRQMALEALGRVGLSDEVRVKNRMLSGGMKRKVLVACAIASEAEVLFLDEPTTGLDHISRKDLWSILRDISRERTIVLTTHYLDEAESLSRSIAVMSHGRLLALGGSMDDLRSMMKHPVSIRVYGPPRPR